MSRNSKPAGARRPGDEHPGDDRLFDLAHQLLPESEENELLTHLAACASCEERFRVAAGDIERLRARADDALASAGARPAAEPAPPARAANGGFFERFFRLRPAWGFGAIAAVACTILAIVILHPRGPSPEATALLTWLPTPGEDVVTRDPGATGASAELTEGLAAYSRHDARAAVRLLGQAHASGAMTDIARIYYGSALALSGDFAGAASHLSEVETRFLPEPWQDETRWTLYVALKESGQAARADSLLHTLAGRGGDVGERARRVLGGR